MTKEIPPFIFFGTPSVARDTLEHLKKHSIVPSLIITNPDAPRGRGRVLTPSEVKTFASANNIAVETPEKLNAETIKNIASYGYAFAIVVAYGKIFPEELIKQFPKGVLNIHYSLLPKYRGASPVEETLKNGDEVTGVSIQKMVLAVDAGDVLASREIQIKPKDTTSELRARLIIAGAELLADTLSSFVNGDIPSTKQNEAEATYTKKIKKEAGLLSLSEDAEQNWNKYRAYFESPGTFFFANRNEKRIRVKIVLADFSNNEFIILRVVPESKKEQGFDDFTRAGWVPE